MEIDKIYCGDALNTLKKIPDEFVDCVVTSPPYWGLRDYGVDGQIGLEPALEEYLEKLLVITKELKRVLKPTGIMFWNHGDCYGGIKTGKTDKKVSDCVRNSQRNLKKYAPKFEKCLMLQNYRLILKMVDRQNWILRNIIIWHKSNHMPSSVKDRFANSYEPVFFFSKSKRYWSDLDAVRVSHKAESLERVKRNWDGHREPMSSYESMDIKRMCHPHGKNPGDVWKISTGGFKGAHFATFPEKLITPTIKFGCPKSGVVLDPFMGAGTTGLVAKKLGRHYIGIELNKSYVEMAEKRIAATPELLI